MQLPLNVIEHYSTTAKTTQQMNLHYSYYISRFQISYNLTVQLIEKVLPQQNSI